MKRSQRLQQIRKSREFKSLFSNFISLSSLQIAGYVFPLLTVPYLARTIGVDNYGKIAFSMAIIVYFRTIVDYGFIYSTVRDIARCKDDKDAVSTIYSGAMWSRGVLLLISLLLLSLCIILIPKLLEMKLILYASFIMVIGHTLFPDWMFQGLEKMKYITIFNLLVQLIFTITVFIFIKKPSDYILQPLLTSLGYIISGMCSMLLIRKWGIKLKSPQINQIKQNLQSNFDLFVNQIIPNLYNSASVLLLGFLYGNTANGIYDVANRFSTVGCNMFSVISRTFYPFLARRIDKHSLYEKLNVILSITLSILLFVFAPWMIDTFFPQSFVESTTILRILSISIIFWAMGNVYGTNFLILKGFEKELRTITLKSSIVGFAIAIPLVYFYSYTGVAITITIARGLIAFLSYWKVREVQRKEKSNQISTIK